MKLVKAASLVILFGAITAAVVLYVRLDSIVKSAIETVGPRMTLASVKVSSVHISPFSGTGRIHQLEIGNPRGFQSDTALKLKNVRVSLVPRSLASEKIVIRELIVDGPEITYEVIGSGSNLQKIQKNIESFVPASKTEGKTAPGKEKKLEIGLFVLKNAKVHVLYRVIGNQELDLSLPDIRLEGIGHGPGGATAKEAVSAVFQAITHDVVQSVANSGSLKNLKQSLKSAQGNLQKSFRGLFSR